ncbi:Sensitive to high expression protein 9, mitochondrial [Neonectria ditissima]|uniref:Sensitive to high expression protein 9, mitochondrial n=1 Tax=Neonectria ditissima TaxID=78410 RepID=A0A0P7C0K4_9HYPO|nr:Sensitive to high expression protein 9, mitochondrial [Neonectria ditissima]
MQPFARPVARLALGHARLGLDRAAWQGKPAWGRGPRSDAACLRCSIRAIGARGRFYSSQIPPKDPEAKSGSASSQPTESTPEPDLIARLHAEHKARGLKSNEIKTENAKTDKTQSESEKAEDRKRLYELPSSADDRRGDMTQRFSHIMDNLQTRALNASQTLNDITGYTGIEAIKAQNAELEKALADAHERVRNARLAYKTSNTKRAGTQREVTTLLARKDSWSPTDLERFTQLYRTDHILEGEVAASQETLTESEAEEQSLSQRLNAGMLKRYHEEQIWSDRIRRASTWGTWGLMGMNFLLFVILQFVAEPWKRRRLVRGVVAEEKAVLEEVRSQLEEVKLALEKRDQVAAVEPVAEALKLVEVAQDHAVEEVVMTEPAPVAAAAELVIGAPFETSETPEMSWKETFHDLLLETWEDAALDLAKWRALAEDLYSERRIDLRMKDASLLALQGALAGVVLTGSIALLLVRRS